jgi:hypothetical protein
MGSLLAFCSGFGSTDFAFGLARSGRRRAKGPLYAWIKVGLDLYVDPDIPELYQDFTYLSHGASVTWSTKTAD